MALIIAGGYATRLKPYSESVPKALFELEPSVTILDYTVSVLGELGITEYYVVTRSELESLFAGRVGADRVVVVDVKQGDGNLWTIYQAIMVRRGIEGRGFSS